MHNYSINNNIREQIIRIISIVSYVIGLVFMYLNIPNKLLQLFNLGDCVVAKMVIYTFSCLGVVSLYNILMYIYNKYLWRRKFLLDYCHIPDFNGRWEGKIYSPLKDRAHKITVDIKQTWNNIVIHTHTENGADAVSTSAEVCINGSETILSYSFSNIRNGYRYVGYNSLQYYNNELNGEYFTGKDLKGSVLYEQLKNNGAEADNLIKGIGSKGIIRIKRQ